VAANDSDPDGNVDPSSTNATCDTCTLPTDGTLDNNGDGTFTYTPDPGFTGSDSFVYQICDTVGACDTATATITVRNIIEVRVSAGDDDAEEQEDLSVGLGSSDLELVREDSNQTVGMRFNGIDIPQGAAIAGAYIQFQTDETDSEATSLTIQGEATDNAPTFVNTDGNISSRARTTAAVSWSPPPWTTKGEAGPDQQTPDIAPVIQEIINRPGWSSDNSLVIIITGSGKRVAESYNGDQAGAPLLHVEYTTGPPNDPPVASDDNASTSEDTPVIIDVAANDSDPNGNLDPTSANTACPTCADPANGALVNSGDGTFDYSPNLNFNGSDSFVYEICDTLGVCATATVSLTVDPVADPPVANDDSASTSEDTPVTIDVAANDTDPDGDLDPNSANSTCANGPTGCNGAANGSLADNGDGTITYTPDPGFTVSDSFV
jgi:hypothetical protein